MGTSDTYCSFCSGPLEDARKAWIYFLKESCTSWPPKDGEWYNPPGFPVPEKPIEEIVTIDEEDGKIWDDWVVVSPVWAKQGWVSPPCVADDYGGVEINDDSEWNTEDQRFLQIHRVCLSFLCRRLSISPQEYWEALYAPDADYQKFGETGNGLLYILKYYDMEERTGQYFGYAREKQTPMKDDPHNVDRWKDPATMEDTAWILSRPTVLPPPEPLPETIIIQPPISDARRLFDVQELLDVILTELVSVSGKDIINELSRTNVFDPPSVIKAAQSLLSLAQVDRWFYRAVIRDRQGLFLRLASSFGWMLPCTPADWSSWPAELTPLSFALSQPYDWRGYLLKCVRKEEPHVHNRWRFHKMTVQIARGRYQVNAEGETTFTFVAGKLGLPSTGEKPEPAPWEVLNEGQ
ncbi:hypothetical protein V5O48_000274 [Marasmius crinis-equi]|uniref:Uncharacterized protein n=1 Tax=Marasmius crinis-equi TaxID=585013 RepID=A0ABR3G219_9AGAR